MNPDSRYWKDMFIDVNRTDDSRDSDSRVLSTDLPVDFPTKYKELEMEIYHTKVSTPPTVLTPSTIDSLTIKSGEKIIEISPTTLFDTIGNDLITFITQHNQMYTGIYELIDAKLLSTLFNLDTYVFILRYTKNNKIMGSMITVIYDSNAFTSEETLKSRFALTSYLCVHKQLRSQGVCMLLIRKALLTAHHEGILCSYYLEEKPFSKSGLSLKRCMRPINVASALSKGYTFKLPDKREKTKRKLAYAIPKNQSDYRVKLIKTDLDVEESYQFLQDTTLNVNPLNWIWKCTLSEWTSWCLNETFETLMLLYKNKIVGLITIQYKQIYVPTTQTISKVSFIPFHITYTTESTIELVNCAIRRSSECDVDMMYMFQCGSINGDVIDRCKAVGAGHMYIDFYNYTNSYSVNNIYMPLL